jgi:prepilin-type N-terminal cleavage/methylation domain-containing protein/prepilin-type processing-associated H-X9-DG protein
MRKGWTVRIKKAFTLVELLVVISIIAILLSILMPALSKARQQGYRIVCNSLAKSYALANATYASTYNGKFVPFSQMPTDILANTGDYGVWDERWPQNKDFRNALAANRIKKPSSGVAKGGWNDPFIFPKELRCPAHKIPNDDVFSMSYPTIDDATAAFKNTLYLKNFMAVNPWAMVMSFAMNTERWAGNDQDAAKWMPSDHQYRGHTQGNVTKPSDCAAFVESNYYQTRYARAKWSIYWDKFGDVLAATPAPGNWAQVAYRHAGRATIIFFDGHAKSIVKTVVYDPTCPANELNPANRVKPNLLWDSAYPLIGPRGNGF